METILNLYTFCLVIASTSDNFGETIMIMSQDILNDFSALSR